MVLREQLRIFTSGWSTACRTLGSRSLGVVVKIIPAPWLTASAKASSAFSSVSTFS